MRRDRPIEDTNPPALSCLGAGHMLVKSVDVNSENYAVIASWCLWCGTGVSDPDRLNDNNEVINGSVPSYPIWHEGDENTNLHGTKQGYDVGCRCNSCVTFKDKKFGV